MQKEVAAIRCWPSGRLINLLKPTLAQINIADIAHSLALQCRYLGHTKEPYSIAQHSVFVASQAEPKYRLAALLHDAEEAYTADLPRPFKRVTPALDGYREIQNNVAEKIMAKFGIDWSLETQEYVSKLEQSLFPYEEFLVGRDILPEKQYPEMTSLWSWKIAEQRFLKRFYSLYRKPESEF